MCADLAEHERVAIGRGFGANLRANQAASARTIVDDDLLTPALAEFGGREARDDVRGTADRTGNEPHRMIGICNVRAL